MSPATRNRPQRPRRQRGAALLVAMLAVAMVATLASAMVWQQWRAVQVEAAERGALQSAWLLQSGLDLTRFLLREHVRVSGPNGPDVAGELWSIPLQDMRLSDLVAADKSNLQDAPDAFLSGAIVDAQSRFNLRNLLDGDQVSPVGLAVLRKLCEIAGVGASVADTIAARLREAALPPERQGAAAPLLPQSVDQLGWLGIDPDSVRRLAPLVVLLPVATPVNVNTASREVIAAAIPDLDVGGAERLTQRRPFASLDAVKTQLGMTTPPDARQVGISSSYFEVTGRVRLDNHILQQKSILRRQQLEVAPLSTERTNLAEPPT